MENKAGNTSGRPTNAATDKELSPEALRALQEAEDRELQAKAALSAARPKEHYGPKGQEPTRFGDWERKGITYDF